MTEAEWLACIDPQKMLEFLRDKTTDRKLRLLAVACVQRYAAFDGAMSQIIRVSELYADGLANWTDLAAVRKMAKELRRRAMQRDIGMGAGAVRNVASVAHPSASVAANGVLLTVVAETAIRAIREVFGNPFSPVRINPTWGAWNDGTVVKLAQGIYDDQTFDRLPVLADALEESGCTNADALNHCRLPGEHGRGCWVVDAILGKT